MKKKSFINSLSWQFIKITYLPMIALILIITISGSSFITRSINQEAKDGMRDLANTILYNMDLLYKGPFSYLQKDGEIYLLKGDYQLNGNFDYIDKIKESTGCDITFTYMGYAVITTLRDTLGTRLIGAGDSDIIINDVVISGNSKFYDDVQLNKENYIAYYVPIYDADNKIIGMLSIAQKSDDIKILRNRAVVPILLIAVVAMIVATIYSFMVSKDYVDVIKKIQKYMKEVSLGNFRAQLDHKVEKRKDELGDMGDSAVKTAVTLRKMVEEDQLTNLLNRRSADKKIRNTIDEYITKGVNFSVALGDIDFFKKVNDTYGHEAGDLVLIAVSATLKDFMGSHGYAIRWGGEEFLLIFEKGKVSLNDVHEAMLGLLDRVHDIVVVSGDNEIKVNMTFGIVECDPNDKLAVFDENNTKDKFTKSRMDYYISEADRRLYYGKEHGRNQIVAHEV